MHMKREWERGNVTLQCVCKANVITVSWRRAKAPRFLDSWFADRGQSQRCSTTAVTSNMSQGHLLTNFKGGLGVGKIFTQFKNLRSVKNSVLAWYKYNLLQIEQ
jgi:hypothetical protein